jgi:hypothetical protein
MVRRAERQRDIRGPRPFRDRVRIEQEENYYKCELTGATVEDAMAELTVARQSLIDWP